MICFTFFLKSGVPQLYLSKEIGKRIWIFSANKQEEMKISQKVAGLSTRRGVTSR